MNWGDLQLRIDTFLEDLFLGEKGTPYHTDNTTMPLVPIIPAPIAPAPIAIGERLYEAAYAALGSKIAPRNIAEVGCSYCVNHIYKQITDKDICSFPSNESTFSLYVAMARGPFTRFTEPRAGDIVISPTTLGNGVLPNGHVGIVGKNIAPNGSLWIMSNNSPTGTWEVNFTVDGWHRHYAILGGFPQVYFRPN